MFKVKSYSCADEYHGPIGAEDNMLSCDVTLSVVLILPLIAAMPKRGSWQVVLGLTADSGSKPGYIISHWVALFVSDIVARENP